jgi:catechol 2,3-dioxygenase-like lactoylglutathione lyase family enzyme
MPLGHLGINVADLSTAKRYYDELMPLLGYEPFFSTDDEFSYRPVDAKPGTFLFFYPSQEPGEYSRHRSGVQHLAFIVKTRPEVHAARDAADRLGSEVLIEPKEFPEYHPGYYAAFWLDPFGQMLEVVCHRDPASGRDPMDS